MALRSRFAAIIIAAFLAQSTPAISAGASACEPKPLPSDAVPGTLSPTLLGAHLLFNQANDKMRARKDFLRSLAGIPIRNLRFPGGTIADNYLWRERKTGRDDWFPFNHKSSSDDLDFDEFMSVARCLGAQPAIVLNLRYWLAKGKMEEGMAEAEDWVRYANIEKKFAIRNWEFGNEVYGGKPQQQSPLTAEQYGAYYGELRSRLKKIDPQVELGMVLPNEPDFVAAGGSTSWWNGAIGSAGSKIDFVVLHKYPVPRPRKLMNTGSGMGEMLAVANSRLRKLAGRDVPIHLTEWNIGSRSAGNPKVVRHDSIGHALFVADALLDMADNGVLSANFWPLIGPRDQGLLDASDLSLNAAGQTMRLLGSLAGWRLDAGKTSEEGGLSLHVLANGGKRRALIAINRSKADRVLDYRGLVGPCEASAKILKPAGEASGVSSLAQRVSAISTESVDAEAFSLSAFSVTVLACR